MTPILGASLYWHFPIMIVLVSLVYSATRHDRWDMIFHEAWRWGLRMVSFLLTVGLFLFLVSSL